MKRKGRPTIEDVRENYVGITTVGGFAHGYYSYFMIFRILWIVIVIAGTIGTGLQLYWLISDYRSYPIQVTVSLKTNDTLDFPGVTVCNLNPIKLAKISCSIGKQLASVQEKFALKVLKHVRVQKIYKEYRKMFRKYYHGKPLKMVEWLKTELLQIDYVRADCGNETMKNSNVSEVNNGNVQPNTTSYVNKTVTELSNGTIQQNAAKDKRRKREILTTTEDPNGIPSPPDQSPTEDPNGIPSLPDQGPTEDPNGIPSPPDQGPTEDPNGIPSPPDQGPSEDPNGMPSPPDQGPSEDPNGMPSPPDQGPTPDTATFDYGFNLADYQFYYDGYPSTTSDDGIIGTDPNIGSTDTGFDPAIGIDTGFEGDDVDTFSFLEGYEGNKYDFSNFMRKSRLYDLEDVKDVFSFTADMKKLGYDGPQFVAECTIDRSHCNVTKDFVPSINKRYGNCFTFNSALEGHRPNKTSKSGNEFGLRLTLDIAADQYIGLLAPEYGVRLSVHDSRVQPTPEADGIHAAPGMATEVAVRLTHVSRLKKPYKTNCTHDHPPEYKKFAEPNSAYTTGLCRLSCLDYHLYKECGCVEQIHLADHLHLEQCTMFKKSHRTCQSIVHWKISLPDDHAEAIVCHCQPKCEEHLFRTSVSQAKWPTVGYQRLKMANFYGIHPIASRMFHRQLDMFELEYDTVNYDYMATKQDRKSTSKDFDSWVSNNLVRLHIYYESLTYEIIEERPEYTIDRLWSDIGGALGIYLGLSIVTAVELVELVITLIYAGCKKGQNPKASVNPYNHSAGSKSMDIPPLA